MSVVVIIGDFHVVGPIGFPDEADPVLKIDSDAVLPFAIFLQRF